MKKLRMSRPSPALLISGLAIFAALAGTSYAEGSGSSNHNPMQSSGWATHLGGWPASAFLLNKHFATSDGVRFFSVGRTVTLGKVGHYTFTSTCSKDSMGQNQVTFDVTANTTADLDGNGPSPAGTKVNIHTNSTTLESTMQKPLKPGDFDQVASASSSTEIAADGQEVDIFYTDGVNWPVGNGSRARDCFAGYTGFLG
jgi:hypothetical protein